MRMSLLIAGIALSCGGSAFACDFHLMGAQRFNAFAAYSYPDEEDAAGTPEDAAGKKSDGQNQPAPEAGKAQPVPATSAGADKGKPRAVTAAAT